MALSPIAPAALQVQQAAAVPTPAPTAAFPADAAVSVVPTANAAKNGGADSATSGNAQQSPNEKLPLEKALEKINESMEAWSTQAEFSIDPDTHRVVISIKDTKTGDTIKTIPSETVLRIAKMITEFQGGAVKTTA